MEEMILAKILKSELRQLQLDFWSWYDENMPEGNSRRNGNYCWVPMVKWKKGNPALKKAWGHRLRQLIFPVRGSFSMLEGFS